MDQLGFRALYAPTARKFAVVLGTNEIASAVAARLARARFAVAMSHDPFPPTIRRGMAFHDALYGDRARVDGVDGVRVDTAMELASASMRDKCVAVTTMHLSDLLALRPIDVLVDARMQKNRVTPDYRHYVRLAIGLGPNFIVGENCDIAVETRPDRTGGLVESGETRMDDGKPRMLGGVGRERFVYTDRAGSGARRSISACARFAAMSSAISTPRPCERPWMNPARPGARRNDDRGRRQAAGG